MLDEYLALGGVEIGNNARAYEYSLCLPCCVGLLKCPGCDGIHDATNDWTPAMFDPDTGELVTAADSMEPAYSCDAIERAPWYDENRPESALLAGFYILGIQGITDGTGVATVTESIDPGGVISATHEGSRVVRVREMIVGCGMASVEYGLAWLKNALRDGFCGRHGSACGTSDLAFFIDCPPPLEAEDADYDRITAPYRRYLHGVGQTSAPIVVEEFGIGDAWVKVVEFILTAEQPFVYGEPVPASGGTITLTAYDDIPFNLMRYPSGETGDNVPRVVATNYAFNGSAEFGGANPTGWGHTEVGIAAGITAGQSTDIAAVGPNSYRSRLVATGVITDGRMSVWHDVALGTLPAGAKPSVSVWGRFAPMIGAPVLDSLEASVEWRNAGGAMSVTPLGPIADMTGGNVVVNGLTVPAGATTARITVTGQVDAVAADEVRLYGDAFALTVP